MARKTSKAKNANNGLARQRELAKNGMTLSLAALAVTGLFRTRGGRAAHLAAGAALIGFSVWHHNLYNRRKADESA